MHNFKPGDWVVEIHSEEIHQIIELFPDVCRVIKPVSKITYSTEYTDFKPWHPQPNDWCWFWNYDKQPEFGKATGITPLTENSDFYMGNTTYPYTREHLNQGFVYCEPFLGELPSFLKDTK